MNAQEFLARRKVASKGKKVVVFHMKQSPPTDADLLAAMLTPKGNLRVPTLRRGETLLVGFSEDAYETALG